MRETQVWSLGAAPAHRYYLLMLSTERQFSSISQSNSAAVRKHAAEVNVVSSQAVNLSTNNVSKHGHLAGACHGGARGRARCYLRGCSVDGRRRNITLARRALTRRPHLCETTINKFSDNSKLINTP